MKTDAYALFCIGDNYCACLPSPSHNSSEIRDDCKINSHRRRRMLLNRLNDPGNNVIF